MRSIFHNPPRTPAEWSAYADDLAAARPAPGTLAATALDYARRRAQGA